MTGCASSQKIVRASINRYKNFNKLKIPAKLQGFTATNAVPLRYCASIKPKYLPNRAGDCRFLD
jgi:hypothetical protein